MTALSLLCALFESGPSVIHAGLAVALADAFSVSPGHHLVLSRRHEPDFFVLRSATPSCPPRCGRAWPGATCPCSPTTLRPAA